MITAAMPKWFGLQREPANGYLSAEGCLGLNPDTHTLTFAIGVPKVSYDIEGWPGSPEVTLEEARLLVAGESEDGASDLVTLEGVRETLRQLLDAYDA